MHSLPTPLKKAFKTWFKSHTHGCFTDQRELVIEDEEKVLDRIWAIGGKQGWYYGNWLWAFRGFMDKLVGGVGLRRGRKSSTEISAGDSLDFWRVLLASRKEKRLILYAEMKLPGEAWLEFRIIDNTLYQTATFRPLGLWGRIYWYSVLPFHSFIFRGMINRIVKDFRRLDRKWQFIKYMKNWSLQLQWTRPGILFLLRQT